MIPENFSNFFEHLKWARIEEQNFTSPQISNFPEIFMTLRKRRQELPSYQKEGVSWEKSEGKGTPTAPSNKQSRIKLIIITAQISQKQ